MVAVIQETIVHLDEQMRAIQKAWRSGQYPAEVVRADVERKQTLVNKLRETVGEPPIYMAFPGLWETA